MPKVIIAGAGLVGSLNACFFAERGWIVHIYESRSDIRSMEHVPGRSINLALSQRGKSALEQVGLRDYIVEQGVQMHARLVHDSDGCTTHRMPYGQPGQHIVSINRRHLNEVMITRAERYPNVQFFFEHKVRNVNARDGRLVIERLTDQTMIDVTDADLICACDGAYSAVRRSQLNMPRFEYAHTYIEHGYIELNILPKNGQFAIEPNVFHLWPRGDFTMIALANIDKTFTVTVFAPFDVFASRMNNATNVMAFFAQYFPDAIELIGRSTIIDTFARVAPSPVISIKCRPHHLGDRLLLMGDAAHAMVPFYGQGMNCGFEDCSVLKDALDRCNDQIRKHACCYQIQCLFGSYLAEALRLYSQTRCDDAAAICDLAMYNYLELRDLVNHLSFKIRKKIDLFLNRCFPRHWIPLYSMVTFTCIPYHEAVARRQWQDKIISRCTRSLSLIAIASLASFAAMIIYRPHLLKLR